MDKHPHKYNWKMAFKMMFRTLVKLIFVIIHEQHKASKRNQIHPSCYGYQSMYYNGDISIYELGLIEDRLNSNWRHINK